MADALTLPAVDLGQAGAEYERFLREAPDAGEEYLRSEARVRFEPHDDDVLVAAPGLTVSPAETGAALSGALLPRPLTVPDVSHDAVTRFFAALDGTRTLREAWRAAALERTALEPLLGAAFGSVLFATHAVSVLEQRVSGVEIGRGRQNLGAGAASPSARAVTSRPQSRPSLWCSRCPSVAAGSPESSARRAA